jgi:hypothetical protein
MAHQNFKGVRTLFFFCPFCLDAKRTPSDRMKLSKFDAPLLVIRAGKKINPDSYRENMLPRTCHRATPHLARATAQRYLT